MSLIKRIFQEPNKSYFLFGPRSIGKSTYLKWEHGDNALWIDLLNPAIERSYRAYPERLYETLAAIQKSIIVIDEIQRVPTLLAVVHSIIEEKQQFKFILTGSSARKLKRTSADLLGGRALKCALHPFMAVELQNQFFLDDALKNGLLPLLFEETHKEDILNAYLNLYLREEIQAEGLVRNLDDFYRFLEVISFSHAAILNTTNIARECEVKRKTVENYIQILEDLLLAYQLPVFSKRAERQLTAHPKFYLFDAGVYRILRPKGPLDKVNEIDGASLEGLVAQHLKAWIDYSSEKYTLHFWRTRSGLEVDFIVYGPNEFWAIEVKNTNKINHQDLKPLESFLADYPEAKAILLYRGKERLKIKNVLCLPCEDFLRQLTPNQILLD